MRPYLDPTRPIARNQAHLDLANRRFERHDLLYRCRLSADEENDVAFLGLRKSGEVAALRFDAFDYASNRRPHHMDVPERQPNNQIGISVTVGDGLYQSVCRRYKTTPRGDSSLRIPIKEALVIGGDVLGLNPVHHLLRWPPELGGKQRFDDWRRVWKIDGPNRDRE